MDDGNYEVHATPQMVSVSFNRQPGSSRRSSENVQQATTLTETGLKFYVAIDAKNQLRYSVTSSPFDRQTVGDLVASWIAQGYEVKNLDLNAYLKLAREAQKYEKSLKETVITPAVSGDATNQSGDNSPAPVPEDNEAGQPPAEPAEPEPAEPEVQPQ
jgi:hypothetical protein